MEFNTVASNIPPLAATTAAAAAAIDDNGEGQAAMNLVEERPKKRMKSDCNKKIDEKEGSFLDLEDYAEDTMELQSSIIQAVETLKASLGAQACIINQLFVTTPNAHYFRIYDDIYVVASIKKFDGCSQSKIEEIANAKGGIVHSLKDLMQKDYSSFN